MTYMLKSSLILTLLIFTISTLFGQQLSLEDYKVYSALIKKEILDTTKSVTIISKIIKETETSSAINSIGIDFFTQPQTLDSATKQLINEYNQNQSDRFVLQNQFFINAKVFLVRKSPLNKAFKKDIRKGWQEFYNRYSGSGGIFQFSKIYYSQDSLTAIFYHWHRRNGLNGHGALTIMKNENGEWQLKNEIYLWQA